MITTGDIGKALWPGLSKVYIDQYKDHDVEWSMIFKEEPGTRGWDEETSLGSLGQASKISEGGSVSYDDFSLGYLVRYWHVTYGIGFIITRNAYDDAEGNYNLFNREAQGMARSLRSTKENIAALVVDRACNSSYTMGDYSDGQPLASTAHPNKGDGATQANRPAVGSDLCEATLEQGVIDIEGYRDDRSGVIAIKPKKLIIHRTNRMVAARLLLSPDDPETANRAINALAKQQSIPEGFAVNHYLSVTRAWHIRTDYIDGLKCKLRRAAEFAPAWQDFDTENSKYKATERYAFGWTDWRGWYTNPGAAV